MQFVIDFEKRETLKKKTNKKRNDKIKFIIEYEPSFPDIYTIWPISHQFPLGQIFSRKITP